MKTCNLQRTLREKDKTKQTNKQKREGVCVCVCVCERVEEEYILVKAGKAVILKKNTKNTGLTGHLFSFLDVHYEDS